MSGSTVLQSGLVPPRSRPDADERAGIIRAAYACLSAPHTGPVSVAAILDAAAMSTRAFYRHFESKDELFLAMLKRDSDALARRLTTLANETPGGPVAQLRAWIDHLLGLAYDPQSRAHAVVLGSDEVRVAKGYRKADAQLRADRERILADVLRRGRDDGSFPLAEPELDAAAIHALVDRAFVAPTQGAAPQREQVVNYLLDFALRALGGERRGDEFPALHRSAQEGPNAT
jgi:AcrR family transcriptional regulator